MIETKGGMIVLLIFLLICSGFGIGAFVMFFTKKCGEGFNICKKGHKVPCTLSYDSAFLYTLPPYLCTDKNGSPGTSMYLKQKEGYAAIYCSKGSCPTASPVIKNQFKTILLNSSENIKNTFPECPSEYEYSLPKSYLDNNLCFEDKDLDKKGKFCKQLYINSTCE